VQTLNSILHIEDSGITEESFHEVNTGWSRFLWLSASSVHRLEVFCVGQSSSCCQADPAMFVSLLPLAGSMPVLMGRVGSSPWLLQLLL
jgi:hypothetical protein